jgi:ribosomal protein L33
MKNIIDDLVSFYKKHKVKTIILGLVFLLCLILSWKTAVSILIILGIYYFWKKNSASKKDKVGEKKLCPHCKQEIDAMASRCPHCSGKIYIWTMGRKVLVGFIILVVVVLVVSGSSDNKSTPSVSNSTPVVSQPKTFEDRIKNLAVKTGVTDISFNGIDDEKADSNRPTGSRMITVKLNVPSFYNADSFYRNTGELTGKVFQETFASNPNAYDVLTWFYGPTTDKYGNTSNSVILTYFIDKKTYQKINWQNFNSGDLCDFLKSEGKINGGDTGCNTLANIK